MNKKLHVSAHVTKKFSQAPATVFDACISPDSIAQWMFGPRLREEEIIHIKTDPVVGGNFSFLVKRKDQMLDHMGTYLAINRPQRLAFTWAVNEADSSRVQIDISPKDSGSELTLTHELHPEWADFLTRTEEAWGKMLGVLSDVLSESEKEAARR